jgi:molybdenum cofactor cytidylyltransferase
MIWAIILAAGESKRMGELKLLLPFGEKSIIERVLDSVISSEVDKSLVVLGSEGQKIKKKIKRYPVEITSNPYFQRGMLSSVQWGLQTLPKDAEAALFVLGDQPGISKDIINPLIEAFRIQKKGIVVPVYKHSRGHPVLVDMKYREEIRDLDPEIGLRELIYGHAEDILEVRVKSSRAILGDIDDKEDYMRELSKKNKKDSKKNTINLPKK